jgi:hypothetical protein
LGQLRRNKSGTIVCNNFQRKTKSGKILFSRKEITCSYVECLRGSASAHFVKYSVVVKIKTCPSEDGGLIGPIKSKPYFEKGKSKRTSCNSMAEMCSFLASF